MIRIFGLQSGKRDGEENKNAGENAGRRQQASEIRWQGELNELDLPPNTTIEFPNPNTIMSFNIKIRVDDHSSLWAGATYEFSLNIPANYPYEPPKVHCNIKIYHPNIDLSGNVCLNILRADWKPVLCISAVIMGLNFLFLEPNPNDPLNHEAAELMRNDPRRFMDNVGKALRGQSLGGEKFPRLV